MSKGGAAVVLVTGGCGFLGQSLVKHLQENDDTISEIRVLDVQPYENRLGHEEKKTLSSFVGDLRQLADVQRAVSGCTAVFHTASVIQIGTCVDEDFLYDVNVKGTENVIQACLDQNVCTLVYTGSVDAFKIFKEEINVSEEGLIYPDPSELAFPGYGGTKAKAEKLVIKAHGKRLTAGNGILSTIVLRPTGIFGEGNYQHGPAEVLKNAKKRGGVLLPVSGMTTTLWHLTYVGNIAWAHVLARKALSSNSAIGGQGYFITDDTPVTNYIDFNKRFLALRGFKVSKRTLPKFILVVIAYLVVLISILLKPVKKIRTDFHPRTIKYMSYSTTYNGNKLREVTGYRPLYSSEEGLRRSCEFYKNVPL